MRVKMRMTARSSCGCLRRDNGVYRTACAAPRVSIACMSTERTGGSVLGSSGRQERRREGEMVMATMTACVAMRRRGKAMRKNVLVEATWLGKARSVRADDTHAPPCRSSPSCTRVSTSESAGKRRSTRRGVTGFAASASADFGDIGKGEEEPESMESKLACVRATFFYTVSIAVALPIFALMIIIAPIVFLIDRHRRGVYGTLNTFWAMLSTALFFHVHVQGRENLPPPSEAVVYVANHASYLDIFSLYHLKRSLKYVSKLSNFLIPVIGWSMFLTGHVPLRRTDRKSQIRCLKKCADLLRTGSSLIFFPEGTRSTTGDLAAFKKGAFSVAAKSGARVVPVTILGAGELMRSGKETQLYGGSVKLVVHEPIACDNANVAMKEAEQIITREYEAHRASAGRA